MSAQTEAFFVVSSGRSGTAMLHKALSGTGDIEMHHEYMVHIVQKLGVSRYMELASAEETTRALRQTHAAAVHYARAAHWGDSSNKLSWMIPELAALLPQAKFVHLVRDGRKVAGSYFRKLAHECYDDRSTAILQVFFDDPAANPAPPPEKKYWWPLPKKSDPSAQEFRHFNQFERIAWHWAEINRVIANSLAALPQSRKHFVRLEDLQNSAQEVRTLLEFLNLPYRDEAASMFARPHNVNRPEDQLLDADQAARFQRIAGAMMDELGYSGRAEYVVNY
ncbi:MAG TPA: sulfotransferase [Rhizomicrobium sp.]|nr:sulfotransferase [Rhizomicrobium sp.]